MIIMSRIQGYLVKESRGITLGDDDKLDCLVSVGSVKKSINFVDVIVTKDEKDFKATIKVHGKTDFMFCVEKYDDSVIVKSMVEELKSWLIDADCEDMFQILEELTGLKATLCAYLEDISRYRLLRNQERYV